MPVFNPASATGNLSVYKNGALVGLRPAVNLIDGSNATVAVVDDPSLPAGAAVDVTISTTSGAASAAGAYLLGTMSTIGEGSILAEAVYFMGGAFNGATAWPTANKAIYTPVQVLTTIVIYKLAWLNGATVGTNSVDVGIYTSAGTRLVSSGSTLTSGASAPQVVDITDTSLAPDTYFLAMAVNGTTDTFQRSNSFHLQVRACGVQMQTSAFPLPASATFAAPVEAYVPVLAGVFEGVVF